MVGLVDIFERLEGVLLLAASYAGPTAIVRLSRAVGRLRASPALAWPGTAAAACWSTPTLVRRRQRTGEAFVTGAASALVRLGAGRVLVVDLVSPEGVLPSSITIGFE